MKKIPKKLVLIGVFIALAFVDCKVAFPTGSWRYKITVEVETPEGVKSGSAVREVYAGFEPKIFPEQSGSLMGESGEAVVIDLGKYGTLFTLAGGYESVFKAFPYSLKYSERTREGVKYYSNFPVGKKAELKPDDYPRMVTFEDLNDPKSVKLVYGYKFDVKIQKGIIENNFEEIFGQGIKLKSVIIEITDEPVTRGVVDKYLPKTFEKVIKDGWRELNFEEQNRLVSLTTFKTGE